MDASANPTTLTAFATPVIGGIPLDRETLDQLARALTRYGQGSMTSLGNGANTIRKGARELADEANESLPPWAFPAMEMASTFMPGPGTMDSLRLGREAGGHFREGRWGSGLETMGDAILAPVNDAIFLFPGGGFVKALK